MNNTNIDLNCRVVSGARATGALHLGNYHGAVKNWVELQKKYKSFIFVADWHALTTEYETPNNIQHNTAEMVLDLLGAGLDPEICTLFVQSHVPQHAELHLLLSMLTPLSWLERVPTYKDLRQKLTDKHLATYGFLGYPLLQSADILLYKPRYVPVGEDQISHVELTREIARHFNFIYKDRLSEPLLVEPEVLLTKTSKTPGLDGQKMSKSYHNTIALREDPKSVDQKIRTMPTDPARVRRSDPGEPEKCPVWRFHQVYSNQETQEWVLKGCRTAGIGCIECKKPVIDAVIKEQAPIIERALKFKQNPDLIKDILQTGSQVARTEAKKTLEEVKEVMGLKNE